MGSMRVCVFVCVLHDRDWCTLPKCFRLGCRMHVISHT